MLARRSTIHLVEQVIDQSRRHIHTLALVSLLDGGDDLRQLQSLFLLGVFLLHGGEELGEFGAHVGAETELEEVLAGYIGIFQFVVLVTVDQLVLAYSLFESCFYI